MGEVHGSHFIIVDAVDGEVRKHSPVSEFASLQVNLPSHVLIVDVIFSPLLFPVGGLKCHGKSARHLDSINNWQTRRGFMVEESQHVISDIHRSTRELNSSDFVKLLHGYSIDPIFLLLLSF